MTKPRIVHGRQQGQREVSRYFGCRVSYLQNRVQFVLKASDTAIPIETSDYRLLKILTGYCEGILRDHHLPEGGLLQKG
jgi:hypothetical protein